MVQSIWSPHLSTNSSATSRILTVKYVKLELPLLCTTNPIKSRPYVSEIAAGGRIMFKKSCSWHHSEIVCKEKHCLVVLNLWCIYCLLFNSRYSRTKRQQSCWKMCGRTKKNYRHNWKSYRFSRWECITVFCVHAIAGILNILRECVLALTENSICLCRSRLN